MRVLIASLLILFSLNISVSAQTPQEKAEGFKEQAQSSLKQKDYTKARYLFKKAYEAFAAVENYEQAVECGVQANTLYVRENYYKEGFELCRSMEQLIWVGEKKLNKSFPNLRFPVNEERVQMYIALKNSARAKEQLDEMERMANLAKNDSLTEVLLYTKVSYYYTFNQPDQGDAFFQKLIEQYKAEKKYDKVSGCYKTLIDIARNANNTSLMERTFENYILWTDSVKALTAQDELNVLKRKHEESLQTIQEKDSSLSTRQYTIIGLCVLIVILVAVLIIIAIILLRFIAGNRKLKNSVVIANEHNELKTMFIQNISAQMEPTLDALETSAGALSEKVPQQATLMQEQIAALKKFSDDIQELSSLESSLTEPYAMEDVNAGTFCETMMEKAKASMKLNVTPAVSAPKIQIKTNKEQLERILLYLLKNAAFYTEEGRISLDFKKRGAHTHQFIVTDTGIGIPEELQENLFKPFTQVKDLTTGNGLGLPICSLIATKMNGSLTLDTNYKKGSRFILELHV